MGACCQPSGSEKCVERQIIIETSLRSHSQSSLGKMASITNLRPIQNKEKLPDLEEDPREQPSEVFLQKSTNDIHDQFHIDADCKEICELGGDKDQVDEMCVSDLSGQEKEKFRNKEQTQVPQQQLQLSMEVKQECTAHSPDIDSRGSRRTILKKLCKCSKFKEEAELDKKKKVRFNLKG